MDDPTRPHLDILEDCERIQEELSRSLGKLRREYEQWVRSEKGYKPSAREREEFRLLWTSIRHRFNSLLYHAQLLDETHTTASKLARSDEEDSGQGRLGWAREASRVEQYLFDDIVFNAMSLLDYVGSCVSLIVEGADALRPARWSKALGKVKALAKDPSTSRGSCDDLYQVMKEVNAALGEPLRRYRGEIIHAMSDTNRAGVSRDLSAGTVDLFVHVPEYFSERFGMDEEEHLFEVGWRLVRRVGNAAWRTIDALATEAQSFGYSGPPPTDLALGARLVRSGLIDDVRRRSSQLDADWNFVTVELSANTRDGEVPAHLRVVIESSDGMRAATPPLNLGLFHDRKLPLESARQEALKHLLKSLGEPDKFEPWPRLQQDRPSSSSERQT